MGSFELVKKQMMFLITALIIIFVSAAFYVLLGNFKAGSNVDVGNKETEIIMLRALDCLDNNKQLDKCLVSNNLGMQLGQGSSAEYFNKKIYDDLSPKYGRVLYEVKGLHPYIQVRLNE
jgi:uncharacterized protein (UPF0333 family)